MKPLDDTQGTLWKGGDHKIVRASHEGWSVGGGHGQDLTDVTDDGPTSSIQAVSARLLIPFPVLGM